MAKLILPLPFLLCLAVAGATAALCGRAAAQVTVDLHALDAVPNTGAPPAAEESTPETNPATKPAPRRPPAHHTTATAKSVEKPVGPHAQKPVTKQAGPSAPTEPPPPPKPMEPAAQPPATAAAPAPTPAAPEPPAAVVGSPPPPIPTFPPPVSADAPMAPEAPPPISDDAGTVVDTLPAKDGSGVRLDFKTGESDLTPGTAEAVKALVAAAPKVDTTMFTVMAYAAGVPEDPSTPRRLSLSRALSVRSALIANGVPSTHIYVRALGAAVGDGPADRVDLMVTSAAATPASADAPSGQQASTRDGGTATP